MEDIGGLPDHIQVVVVGVAVLLSTIWGVVKFINPYFDHLTKKPLASETDAVVVSAAFADSKTMSLLSVNIERMNGLIGRLSDSNERLCIALDAQSRASISVAEGARQKIESDQRLISELHMLADAVNRARERA